MGKNEYIPSQEHVNIIWVYGLPIYIALIRHVLDSKERTLPNLVCNFAVHEASYTKNLSLPCVGLGSGFKGLPLIQYAIAVQTSGTVQGNRLWVHYW